jgi:predicted dehydrogenase
VGNALPDPVRVGIIGLSARGGWAAAAHVPALAAVKGFELTALSASSASSARAAGDKFGVARVYDDPVELATADDIDLVVVTVRVAQHRELILPALRAGKMVLSEWPLGNGLTEAQELADLATAAGVSTAVGLQARSAPVINYLRDLIAGGYVGTVLSTSMIASGSSWGAQTSTASQAYLVDESQGATMLSIPFGHTVDALTMVLGDFVDLEARTAIRRPVSVDAESGAWYPRTVPDQLVVSGSLAGGAVAAIHYRGGLSCGTNFHWEINGTDGDLVITGPNGHLQFGRVQVAGARDGASRLEELPTPTRYDLVPTLASTDAAYTVAHAYTNLHHDLQTGSNSVPDFDHAVGTHQLLAEIEKAAASRTRQTL